MVRVLALHGQGTNGTIFQQQMTEVINMLPEDYSFEFFDAEYQCEPTTQVRQSFSPPYLAWYNTPTASKVLESHRQVLAICERHGPFDVVIGFSQGAAVAASLLLHQELNAEPPSFRAAIFVGSPTPFAHRLDVGIDVRRYFGVNDDCPNPYGRPNRMPSYLKADPAYLRNPSQLGERCDNLASTVDYQMFHQTADKVRIPIPSGHFYGRKDPWYSHSKDLVQLCRAEARTELEHDGGHEIPRAYIEELCNVIEATRARIGAV